MATADFGSFEPEAVALLRQVLEDAWERLTTEQRDRTSKSEVALRVLRLARRGERDPIRLRAGAITGIVSGTQNADGRNSGTAADAWRSWEVRARGPRLIR
jgi:hypothetical protein